MQLVSHGWPSLASLQSRLAGISHGACEVPPYARFPSNTPVTRAGLVVNGHPIQPRVDKFSALSTRLDVSNQDARDINGIYDDVMPPPADNVRLRRDSPKIPLINDEPIVPVRRATSRVAA